MRYIAISDSFNACKPIYLYARTSKTSLLWWLWFFLYEPAQSLHLAYNPEVWQRPSLWGVFRLCPSSALLPTSWSRFKVWTILISESPDHVRLHITNKSYHLSRGWVKVSILIADMMQLCWIQKNCTYDAVIFNGGSGLTSSKYAHVLNCCHARSGLHVSYEYDYVFPMGFLAPPRLTLISWNWSASFASILKPFQVPC